VQIGVRFHLQLLQVCFCHGRGILAETNQIEAGIGGGHLTLQPCKMLHHQCSLLLFVLPIHRSDFSDRFSLCLDISHTIFGCLMRMCVLWAASARYDPIFAFKVFARLSIAQEMS